MWNLNFILLDWFLLHSLKLIVCVQSSHITCCAISPVHSRKSFLEIALKLIIFGRPIPGNAQKLFLEGTGNRMGCQKLNLVGHVQGNTLYLCYHFAPQILFFKYGLYPCFSIYIIQHHHCHFYQSSIVDIDSIVQYLSI